MTQMSELVHVARRFQRSIKIDADLQSPDALTGFVCPESSAAVLIAMANHIREGQQYAFTWTGPYGSGKSSLVIALSALTSGDKPRREEAAAAVGIEAARAIQGAFPIGEHGWTVLPVIGRRAPVARIIGEAMTTHGILKAAPKDGWNDQEVLTALVKVSKVTDDEPGIIVFIDEMGKLLEAAAHEGADLYFFQMLAEAAARSRGKLIVVGILHQGFEEYSNRLARSARDEWNKIQGRFIDLAVNTAGEEQIDLLARAIQTSRKSEPTKAAIAVANCIQSNVPGASNSLPATLEATWPLHPIVASLLGPLSRRRFGQNQRSLFSFLNSAEPYGFQDFINTATADALYTPDRLWDYLRVNLEPSIMASPDGHRWATAAEAIDRCEASRRSNAHISILKTIALIDLFKDRSGLFASPEILATVDLGPDSDQKAILQDLTVASFVIYRKHIGAYGLYAGSDFDIEAAIESALQDNQEIDFEKLHSIASIHPILAKRHYFKTGALRWVDVKLVPLTTAAQHVKSFKIYGGTIGLFLLALPTQGESKKEAERICEEASLLSRENNVLIGYPEKAWSIINLTRELNALESIRVKRPELSGDKVARKEVETRTILIQNELESELQQAMSSSNWFRSGHRSTKLRPSGFNNIASEIADSIYKDAPTLHNELLNRNKPSSSAIAAQNMLLKAMVSNESEHRLGIEGYPAEGGLFESLLNKTDLHIHDGTVYKFQQPAWYNPCNLRPAWDIANKHLKANADRPVPMSEILDLWEAPPIGMKRGVMPVLATAFVLSIKKDIAIYREGLFQPSFTELDADYLAREPRSIQLRWIDLSKMSSQLLSGLSDVVSSLTSTQRSALTPLEVARGIIAIFDKLPNWTTRTQRLSDQAKAIRNILKNAHDPNQLLFNDLPSLCNVKSLNSPQASSAIVTLVRETLGELLEHYPKALRSLEELMLAELDVTPSCQDSLLALRRRAKAIKQLSGDFRSDAFINRMISYDASLSDIEGVAGLAANKPSKDWVDTDLDRARIEIVAFTEKFKRTELYSRAKGSSPDANILILVSSKDKKEPLFAELRVDRSKKKEVEKLVTFIEKTINDNNIQNSDIILAALSKLSANQIEKLKTAKAEKEEPIDEPS